MTEQADILKENNKTLCDKTYLLLFVCFLLIPDGLHVDTSGERTGVDTTSVEWKAGVERVAITPDEPVWMSGYVSRDRPSEGTRHELWAKALALEDANGQQAVLVTADLRNFPKNISDRIRDRVDESYGLARSQIILNGSHTHTGPLLDTPRNHVYLSMLDPDEQEKVERYSDELTDRIVTLVGKAIGSLEPALLYAENGVARFAVNRRNNAEATLDRQPELQGPADHAVPVIKVENAVGELMAVVFGYACHPTVLSDFQWSGDYPGFAQLELEKRYPGVTALYFQGAAGDLNPLPRRSAALAEQYGKSLAAAVSRVLGEEMRPLPARLETGYTEVDLPFSSLPELDDLHRFAEDASGYQKRWADYQIRQLKRDEPLMSSYPYPLQIWSLGGQPIFSLGGELVVDYAIELKRIFGRHAFVMGYSNDVMGYIPSERILEEGGYEGESSQMVRNLPATWQTGIQSLILREVVRLAGQTGIPFRNTR